MELIQNRTQYYVAHSNQQNEAYLHFAALAAVPFLLSPDLLYKLWRNFKTFTSKEGKTLTIPHWVVSDLLLANFCCPVGYQLFKYDENLRIELLKTLTQEQKIQVAKFLEQYANRVISATDKNIQDIHLRAAMFYTNPTQLIKDIKQDLTGLDEMGQKVKEEKSNLEKLNTLNFYFQIEDQSTTDSGLGLALREAKADETDVLELERRFLLGGLEERIGRSLEKKNEVEIPKFLTKIPSLSQDNLYDREVELWIIKDKFEELNKKSLKRCCINVLGSTGSGKTTFALQYIEKYKEYYNHIIWIDTNLTLKEGIRQLCNELNIVIQPNDDFSILFNKIIGKLSYFKHPCLLVIDDFEEIILSEKDLKKLNNFDILLTSSKSINFSEYELILESIEELKEENKIVEHYNSDTFEIHDDTFMKTLKFIDCNIQEVKITRDENLKTLEILNSNIDSISIEEKHTIENIIFKNSSLNSLYTRDTSSINNLIIYNSNIRRGTVADLVGLKTFSTDNIGNLKIGAVKNVENLTINESDFSDFSIFKDFKNLITLDLKNNKIETIDFSILENLNNLQSLCLQGNPISNITKEIVEMENCLYAIKALDTPLSILNWAKKLEQKLRITLIKTSNIDDITNYGKSSHYIQNELGVITHLSLNEQKIRDISFLEEVLELETLYLYDNEISNISILKKLKKLKNLCLSLNHITDISVVSELLQLEDLRITRNGVKDLSLISTLTNLKHLRIRQNKIVDNSFLETLQNLEELWIGINRLKDLGSIRNLKKLKKLHIEGNDIWYFSEEDLRFLSQLEYVNLKGNPFVEGVTNIHGNNYIDFIKEQIEDILPLSPIEKLEEQLNYRLKETNYKSDILNSSLRESGFYIKNEQGLVTHLNLLGLELRDLSFLQDFKDLEVLNLSGNRISKIEEIGQLTKLRILNLENNRIEDIEPVSKLYDLEELYLSGNQISSSFFLMTLKNLRVIELQNNKIFEIYLLTGIEPKITNHFLYLDKLDILKLYNNPICKMNLVVFEQENCAKTLEEYEQSNDWIIDYYIYEVDYNYEFIKRGLDKIFAKSIEYRNFIVHNNLEKLKQFIEKHRQEIESYYKIKVDVKVKIKGIEEPFILDLIHSNSYERNMGNEEQYEATILMNIGSKGKDEIKISFYEYPVGVANYVSVDNKYGHLVESTNDVLLNQFQQWLNISNIEKKEEVFSKPEQLKSKVRDLIAKAKTEEAMKAIATWAHENSQSELRDSISLLQADWTVFNRERMLGIIGASEANVRQAQLNYRVLGVLDSIEPKDEPRPRSIPPKSGIIRILMLTANPSGTSKLNLDKEFARITERLQNNRNDFDLKIERAVDFEELKEFTEKHKPHFLHFSGHGEGGIYVQNDDKNGSYLISNDGLEALFEYFKEEGIIIKAVILNACYTEEQVSAIANHVPYVIGTTISIGDECAIAFSTGFYFKLKKSIENIETAFNSGRTQSVLRGAKKEYFVLYKDGKKLEI